MNKEQTRILVVEDHVLVRQGLRQLLATLPGVQAIDEAGDGPAALEQMALHPAGVVILDAHLPQMDGVEVTRRILAEHPGTKVLMLSGDSSIELVLEALRAGALAYIVKENSLEELAHAIGTVRGGKAYLSPEVVVHMARLCRENRLVLADSTPLLSEHEKQLLQLIAHGKRNKEIAVCLNVTTKSVEAYRSRLMAKLGCETPADLTRFAIRAGIAPL